MKDITESIRSGRFYRKSWQEILLILGGSALLAFIGDNWSIPAAAWIAPILILRFFRKSSIKMILILGFPLIALGLGIRNYVLFSKFIPLPFYVTAAIGFALIFMIPYFIDKYFSNKFKGIFRTLVFPLAGVILSFLMPSSSGTWVSGATAHSQYGQIPLLQLVSVTGMWGISFLISWLAPVINDLMDDFSSTGKRRLAGIYFSILCFIIIAGEFDTTFQQNKSGTVRVASITVDNGLFDKILNSAFKNIPDKEDSRILQDKLFTESENAVQSGAKILFWSEMNGMVFKEDEAGMITRGTNFAVKHGIYFFMSLWVIENPIKSSENKVVAIGPDGNILFTYIKPTFAPGDPYRKGDGIIKSIDTEFGRLSCAICSDMDYPALIRQAGKLKVDILIVPADDWKAIDPLHSEMSVFRVLENGFSMVRQARQGLSVAVDYHGNVLSSMDYYNTKNYTMISDVPVKGRLTIYSIAGDWFAYLCLAVTAFMIVWLVFLKKRTLK
jgi:apolipoprotein N-acyltransferase